MPDFREIKNRVIQDAIVPTAKDAVFEIVKEVLRSLVYGNKSSTERGSYDCTYTRSTNGRLPDSSDRELPNLTDVLQENIRRAAENRR
jgi:hypothetical protein